jgi:nickel transport protein
MFLSYRLLRCAHRFKSQLPMKPHYTFILALLPTLACGHDLWIERTGPLHSLSYGHERSGHEGAKRLEYKPESVKQAACYNTAGQEQRAEQSHSYPVTLKGDCAASWFLMSSGYWSKTPYGTKNLPKSEAGAVIDSWLSIESIKRIDRWSESFTNPQTRELELVALENPTTLKTGAKLHLRANFQGKPAANVTVAYFGKPRGVTGSDGTVNIRLNEPGFQLIQASLELPLNDGKADKAIHSSALQFEIK